MKLLLMTAALLAAAPWRFDVQTDPLGQSVYVAEVAGSEDLPQAFLRFSCGGMPGVLLQFNLGQAAHEDSDFRADDPAWEDVTFLFPEGEYPTATKRAAIADGIGTFEIKGSEAMFIARQFKAWRGDLEAGRAEHALHAGGCGRTDQRGDLVLPVQV